MNKNVTNQQSKHSLGIKHVHCHIIYTFVKYDFFKDVEHGAKEKKYIEFERSRLAYENYRPR